MRGGKRSGSGRKKHVPNRASAAREREAKASGLTPADILLHVMREFWKLAQESRNARKRSEHLRAAAAVAQDAAPYFHAKVTTTAPGQDDRPRKVIVEVIGGLPSGSTPEKPEGDNYSDVPDEEPRWASRTEEPAWKRTPE
jgi:hypothetical protein